MNSDIQERVARGVALLDRVEPGWFHRVNTEKLDLSHGGLCVLGQLYGHYCSSLGRLSLSPDGAAEHGFQVRVGPVPEGEAMLNWVLAAFTEYPALNQEWQRVIAILKSGQAPVDAQPQRKVLTLV